MTLTGFIAVIRVEFLDKHQQATANRHSKATGAALPSYPTACTDFLDPLFGIYCEGRIWDLVFVDTMLKLGRMPFAPQARGSSSMTALRLVVLLAVACVYATFIHRTTITAHIVIVLIVILAFFK